MSAYVYIWYKPDATPFYVGVGTTNKRWNPSQSWHQRNPFCKAVLKKYGTDNILLTVFGVPSLFSAFRFERLLIHRIGRADIGAGPLTNITAGGEGTVNLGEMARQTLRNKWAGNTQRKKKLSTQSQSEANRTRAKKRAADPNDLFAKVGAEVCSRINADPTLTDKRINALKAASQQISEGVKRSMEARLKTMRTPEVQEKLRRPKTEEHRAKIAAAKREYWAKKKAAITLPQQ